MELLQIAETRSYDASEIADRTRQIHAALLAKSKYLDAANFIRIHTSDLDLLFEEYDGKFFDGTIRGGLGSLPLTFGLSARMTSAAGKTACYTDHRSGSKRFEISVSTTILFGCFRDEDHRPIMASGIPCRDRLDALQRVMEHELLHLVEMLLWEQSSCSQPRFGSMAHRFFGHTASMHQLITPRERAIMKFGIRPGMMVRFRFDGVEYRGIVNRITRRATVLVENDRGQRYSNGKQYLKFYVPVQMLEAVE